jgi:transposase
MDAILYIVKCGCQRRYLPTDFRPWQIVYHVFRQWTRNHQWADLNDALNTLAYRSQGKRARPTAAILDSRSVKSDGHGSGRL